MSRPIHPGLYEQLITEGLDAALAALPPDLRVHIGALDAGDSHDVLARHIYDVVRRSLKHLDGEGSDKLAEQLTLCNELLTVLAHKNRQGLIEDEKVAPPPRALNELARTSIGYRSPQRPTV